VRAEKILFKTMTGQHPITRRSILKLEERALKRYLSKTFVEFEIKRHARHFGRVS
jgi:hypothetical protein